MGEIADMVLDGTLCDECGQLIDVPENDGDTIEPGPGYPRTCQDCDPDSPDQNE